MRELYRDFTLMENDVKRSALKQLFLTAYGARLIGRAETFATEVRPLFNQDGTLARLVDTRQGDQLEDESRGLTPKGCVDPASQPYFSARPSSY